MKSVVAVFAGGIVGTALRLLADSAAPSLWATLAVNVLGSFVLGFLVARVWPTAPDWVRAGVGAGILGSFTTFSAITVAFVDLANNGEWMSALAYLLGSIALGLGAALLGLLLGRPRSQANAAAS